MSSERQAFNDGFDKGYAKAQERIAQLEDENEWAINKLWEFVWRVFPSANEKYGGRLEKWVEDALKAGDD